MRYLVTGGLGYVGAWAVRHLARAGHTVFAMSRKDVTPDLGVNYTVVQADLASQRVAEIATCLPERLDGIIHAASLNEAFLPDYPKNALLANSLGTRNLLAAIAVRQEAGHNANMPPPVMVYCSTFHVYGKTAGTVDEATPPDPKNDYALTHLFAEQYCRMFAHTHGLPSITVRLTNGYGAPALAGSDKWHLIINDLCRQAVEHGTLTLNANPTLQRDFVWLGDVARAFELLLPRRDLAGKTYLVAAQKTVSLGEVAELVACVAGRILGKTVRVQYKTKPAPTPRLNVNATALEAATGYTPVGEMEAIIADIIAFCQAGA